MIQSENGLLGIGGSPEKGKEDENLCNAAGWPVTVVKALLILIQLCRSA